MKLKYYLRGLGVGIICTAIIMGIALSGKEKEKLTDAEIIERARLLGMVMEEKQAEIPEDTDDEEDGALDGAEDENTDGTESGALDEAGENTAQNDTVPQEQNGIQTLPEVSEQQPVATEPEIKNIEVQPGEYSDVVSQKLFDAGLIPDAAAFNKYLTDSGQDQNIMVGTHQIPMGASQEEIIKILSEKPQ